MIDTDRLKAAKKAKGLSYDDLAAITGFSRSTITNIFCGYIEFPKHDTIQAIERALGISIEPEQTDKLTAEERELLNYFRALNPTMRKYALEIIKAALSTQDKTTQDKTAVETDKNIKFGG